MTKNDLQNNTQKTKDWVTRTPLKNPKVNSGAPEGLASSVMEIVLHTSISR
jgi:hypothetical protein